MKYFYGLTMNNDMCDELYLVSEQNDMPNSGY